MEQQTFLAHTSPFSHHQVSVWTFPSFRNTVWAALFFSCNHCNTVSFLTQSHPVLDARLVPPTQSSPKLSTANLASWSTVCCITAHVFPSLTNVSTTLKSPLYILTHAAHIQLPCHESENPRKLSNKFHINLFSVCISGSVSFEFLQSLNLNLQQTGQDGSDVLGQVRCAVGQPSCSP